jgi:hypothetical protein
MIAILDSPIERATWINETPPMQSALGLAFLLQQKGLEPPTAVAPSTSGSVLMTWHGPGEAYCEVELSRPYYGEVMILTPGKEPEHFVIPNA